MYVVLSMITDQISFGFLFYYQPFSTCVNNNMLSDCCMQKKKEQLAWFKMECNRNIGLIYNEW